jgi:hypothetical protein
MNNSSNTLTLDPRAKKWGNVVKYGTVITTGFFVAPFIWVALGGLLGLVAAGGLTASIWYARNWFFDKAANMRIKLIRHEATKNPTETLRNDLKNQMSALEQRKLNIEKLGGQIRTFANKLADIGEKYGKEDRHFIQLTDDLKNLKLIYKRRQEKYSEACKQLEDWSNEIDRAQMIWDAACAAAAARETSGLTEADFFAKLKTDTALDSIQNTYNQTLASLDADLLEDAKAN